MKSIHLEVETSVEFVLFEKFAYAIILFKEKKDEYHTTRPEFYGYLKNYLGKSANREQISNDFSTAKKKKFYTLSEEQYFAFCNSFNEAYKALTTDRKNKYKNIKASFDAWKLGIDENHGVKASQEENTNVGFPRFPAYLENSKWYTYALHETSGNPVVGRMVMEFGEADGNKAEVTLTHYMKSYGVWKGKAHLTEDFSLVITLTKESNQTSYTHYLFPLSKQIDAYDLCVGHTTYRNGNSQKVVTKIVLMERYLEGHDPKPDKFSLDSKKLPQGFGEFLQLLSFQPLFSPPASKICDYQTLKTWLEDKPKTEIDGSVVKILRSPN